MDQQAVVGHNTRWLYFQLLDTKVIKGDNQVKRTTGLVCRLCHVLL